MFIKFNSYQIIYLKLTLTVNVYSDFFGSVCQVIAPLKWFLNEVFSLINKNIECSEMNVNRSYCWTNMLLFSSSAEKEIPGHQCITHRKNSNLCNLFFFLWDISCPIAFIYVK